MAFPQPVENCTCNFDSAYINQRFSSIVEDQPNGRIEIVENLPEPFVYGLGFYGVHIDGLCYYNVYMNSLYHAFVDGLEENHPNGFIRVSNLHVEFNQGRASFRLKVQQ